MNTSRIVVSLSLFLLAGFGLAACDSDTVEGEGQIAGRACEIANVAVECGGDEGLVSYCGYTEFHEAQNQYGELTQGPCVAPVENECEPGEWRTEPSSLPPEEDICGGTQYACEVVGGDPMWVEIPCNTPLVLRFDESPVEMIAAEATPAATFDINMRADSCITTDWPSAATPWLVVDRDGSGTIDGGHELFGSGTRLLDGNHAEHGFAALVEFDSNHDGYVDALDARFDELMLWRDHDADRLSSSGELQPLAEAGVERLAVDFRVETRCDERGNCGVQRSAFEFAGGTGEVVDLYLACQ